jgi:hypothetical protein
MKYKKTNLNNKQNGLQEKQRRIHAWIMTKEQILSYRRVKRGRQPVQMPSGVRPII